VTVRASGTEPKVKFYSELCSKISREQAKAELQRVVDVIKKEFYQPHKFPMKEQPVM
jgi:phosphomannomutase